MSLSEIQRNPSMFVAVQSRDLIIILLYDNISRKTSVHIYILLKVLFFMIPSVCSNGAAVTFEFFCGGINKINLILFNLILKQLKIQIDLNV